MRRPSASGLLRASHPRPRTPIGVRAVLALAAALLVGCAVPEGDLSGPEQAYYRLLNLRAAGDVEGLWESLHPEARREFERWHASEKLALYEIRTAYPEGDKARALAALGDGARAELTDARALFAKVLTSESAEPLGGLATVAARVRSTEVDEETGRAVIRNWGGDALVFVRAEGGQWYWTLDPAELERLKAARASADENLRRVRANLKKLDRNP